MKNYQNRSYTVQAEEMTRLEYNQYRGWQVPENENPDDKGYMVINPNVSERNVEGVDGYVSWLPEKAFAEVYEAEPQTWQGRLLLEYRQMQTRTEKLHDFLSKNPNHEAATILREQYYAMRQYLTVLQERVAELDEKVREIPPQLPFEDLPEAERSYLQSEGYDYAFDGHSDFSDIPNAEFHRRRKAYLAAREHLAELIRGKDE